MHYLEVNLVEPRDDGPKAVSGKRPKDYGDPTECSVGRFLGKRREVLTAEDRRGNTDKRR